MLSTLYAMQIEKNQFASLFFRLTSAILQIDRLLFAYYKDIIKRRIIAHAKQSFNIN